MSASMQKTGLDPTVTATLATLEQCAALLGELPAGAYTTPSAVLFGGTVGQHVRHSLDHFAAAVSSLEGQTIDYDTRRRGTDVESDVSEALRSIESVCGRLRGLRPGDELREVKIRVMLSADGVSHDLTSTLGRELAFASHHAIHHHAMISAIAKEMGIGVPEGFGKAPSTLKHEQGAAVGGRA